ncbi:MAG: hypothetical protein CMJ18_23410 [Phycisphaeraceae bacterium]|nr:hypothetical protein [Phycisphaeraceae bacterium]
MPSAPSSCRAVMFDLDGTLLDTLPAIVNAVNRTMSDLERPPLSRERVRMLVGKGARYLIRHALDVEDEGFIARGLDRFRANYKRHGVAETERYEGIDALLDELHRRGLALAVLSNKPDAAALAAMEAFFDVDRFLIVRGQLDGGPLKPDPATALDIIEAHGIAADRWIYVGDTAVDMETANNAGMCGVGVLWGFRDRDELEGAKAHHIIDRPSELIELLDAP